MGRLNGVVIYFRAGKVLVIRRDLPVHGVSQIMLLFNIISSHLNHVNRAICSCVLAIGSSRKIQPQTISVCWAVLVKMLRKCIFSAYSKSKISWGGLPVWKSICTFGTRLSASYFSFLEETLATTAVPFKQPLPAYSRAHNILLSI
jgi:hypothetical protein